MHDYRYESCRQAAGWNRTAGPLVADEDGPCPTQHAQQPVSTGTLVGSYYIIRIIIIIINNGNILLRKRLCIVI